jgi:hypothetical protein
VVLGALVIVYAFWLGVLDCDFELNFLSSRTIVLRDELVLLSLCVCKYVLAIELVLD